MYNQLNFRQITLHLMISSALLFASNCMANDDSPPLHWYQFSFENDAMGVTNTSDDGYSNGISYSWGRSPYDSFTAIDMPDWLHFISDWTFIDQGDNNQYSIEFGISQAIYTPDKIEESELIEDDRPYAGTLLWHTKIRNFANNRANSLGLTLGVAGPASLAEQSQTVIHELIGATPPEGWDNQINNELVFRIDAEHIERFYVSQFTDTISFDSSSYSEAGVGNLRSDIGTGLTFRVGNLLEQTYAAITPVSSRTSTPLTNTIKNQFYWQLFASVYASYVFNDISLNGNTFSDSHSVDMKHEQALASVGFSVMYNNWTFVFSTHRGNEQFEDQKNISKYGSLTIGYHN